MHGVRTTTGRCIRLTTLPHQRSPGIRTTSSNIGYHCPVIARRYCNAAMSDEDPIVQYVALRRDLWKEKAWPLGSIVAQGCHAATAALWLSRETEMTSLYCSTDSLDHMRKVRG